MALTDDLTAAGTVGAVVVSLGVTWWAARRADKQLREDRAMADRALRIGRNLAVFQEAGDLYAEYVTTKGADEAARLKLAGRLALLPWTVATTIRQRVGDSMTEESRAKLEWTAVRAGRGPDGLAQVDWRTDLLREELPADVWYLSHDQPETGGRPWWEVYADRHPLAAAQTAPTRPAFKNTKSVGR